jgi:hypothetical protein
MKKKAAILALEVRAGELADTGRYRDWVDVVEALIVEGHADPAGRLGKSPGLPGMLDARCDQAWKRKNAQRA